MKKALFGALLIGLVGSAHALTPKLHICPYEVTVGEVFEVSLASNASTGYRWEISQQTEHLMLVSSEYQHAKQAADETPRVGVPGQQVWHFKAQAAGAAQLQWDYVRPWMPDEVAGTESCSVTVVAS